MPDRGGGLCLPAHGVIGLRIPLDLLILLDIGDLPIWNAPSPVQESGSRWQAHVRPHPNELARSRTRGCDLTLADVSRRLADMGRTSSVKLLSATVIWRRAGALAR